MRSTTALTRLLIKDMASRYTQQLNMKGKGLRLFVFILPLLLLVPVIQLAFQLHLAFAQLGRSELAITYMVAAIAPLYVLTAVPMIISLFFFSKDLGFLATLPMTIRQIVTAKSAVVYAYLAAIGCFTLMPSLVIYAVVEKFRLAALVFGTLAIGLTPAVPMVISVLIALPLMRLIGRTRRRGLWIMLGNILLLAAVVGIQVLVTRLQIDAFDPMTVLSSQEGLIYLIGQKYWPSVWLTQMLGGNLWGSLLYFGLSLSLLFGLSIVMQWLYSGAMQAYAEVSEAHVGAHNVKGFQLSQKSVFLRLVWRHIGIVLGNPTFALQIGMSMFVPLLVGGITLLTGEFQLEAFKSPEFGPFVPQLYLGLLLSPVFMGTLSATVITREGKTFWETRVLPISTHINLQTRIVSSDVMCFVAMLVLGVAGLAIFPLTAIQVLSALLLAAVVTHFFNTVDLYINVSRPLLNWSHPTAAVKNNMNIILALVLRLVLCGVLYNAVDLLPISSFQEKTWVLTGIFAVLYVVEEKFYYPRLLESFRKMEC